VERSESTVGLGTVPRALSKWLGRFLSSETAVMIKHSLTVKKKMLSETLSLFVIVIKLRINKGTLYLLRKGRGDFSRPVSGG